MFLITLILLFRNTECKFNKKIQHKNIFIQTPLIKGVLNYEKINNRIISEYLKPQELVIESGSPNFATYNVNKGVVATLNATSDYDIVFENLSAGDSGDLTIVNNSFQMLLPSGSITFYDMTGGLPAMSSNTRSKVTWQTPNGTDVYLYISNIV